MAVSNVSVPMTPPTRNVVLYLVVGVGGAVVGAAVVDIIANSGIVLCDTTALPIVTPPTARPGHHSVLTYNTHRHYSWANILGKYNT